MLSILGTGGMAEVYRARDARLGRDVALKVVNEALAEDPELVRRFEQEARLAGSLNHPNLVAVYDVGVQDGAAFFITELLKGESLRQRLSRGRIPQQTALDWGAQLAEGLAAAHGRGVVHRDVKPENVFVTSDGHVKLLDFGIAKLAESTRTEGHHGILDDTVTSTGGTKTGAILGTPAYMSPEQVRGEPVDVRTDIFSLGAVLHEMLSGQRAFPGGSLVETGHAILHDEPPPLPEEVPSGVAEVVKRCLEKEPARRLQSASDLAFALELLQGPTTAVRGGRAPPTSAKRLRRLIAIAGVALLVAAVVAGVRVGTRFSSPPALPEIEQVTFRDGHILGARFTPEGRFLVSAAWDGQPEEIFSSAPGDVQLQALGLKDVRLLGVSKAGELAVGIRPQALQRYAKGTLARVPGSGGVPRELAEDVVRADWSPTGELTVVRVVGGAYRIERPLGTPVYEASGGIGDLRVSPDGSHVAFVAGNSQGGAEVRILDAHNAPRVLTKSYAECEGVAWSPNGTEVWFTAPDSGGDALRVAALNGPEREVYRSTGDLKLEDIAADGTVLFSISEYRKDINLVLKSGPTRRNLSWFGYAELAGLSDDGQLVVFSDWRTPLTELMFARRTDGSAPKFLGQGRALDLSADKKTMLALTEAGLVLIPLGPGTPQRVATPGLDVAEGRLFRDGKRVVVVARPIDGRERRVFTLAVESDAGPRPISEVALSRFPTIAVSPDERWVAVTDAQDAPVVLPLAGGEPIRFPEILPEPDASPVEWSAEGDLWLRSGRGTRGSLLRVDLRTHQIQESRQLSPEDPTGVALVWPIRVTPDGSAVAFSYLRARGSLFLMRGAGVSRN